MDSVRERASAYGGEGDALAACRPHADHGIAHMRKALDALREINRLLGDAADQLDGVL